MRRSNLAQVAFAAALLFSTCAFAQLDDEPMGFVAKIPASVKVQREVAYSGGASQRLDVYSQPHPNKAPIIVMVHGGGWRLGDKAMKSVVENKVARWVPKDFIVVSIDYGMLPSTPVTQQVDDVARALAYVQKHATEWGGDGSKVVLMGHSAGAHLVDMLGAAPDRAFKFGAKKWLATISLDSAAVDVPSIMQRRHMKLYDETFGKDSAQWKSLSPIDHLSASSTPFLAVCSTLRPDDSCGQSQRFVDRAQSVGVRAEISKQALSHRDVNLNLGLQNEYTSAVEKFLSSLDPAFASRLP